MSGCCRVYKFVLMAEQGGVYGEYTTQDRGQRKFAVDIPLGICAAVP